MRLIAFKVNEDQYQDLLRTARQRSERSLSNHIRHILEDRLAMRRQYYKTSTRLPLPETAGKTRSHPPVKPAGGPSRIRPAGLIKRPR